MNRDFANFVREASFNLTLSESMISALLGADRDCQHPKLGYGVIYNRTTSTALYRRGLIIPSAKSFPPEWSNSPMWPYCYDLTSAGKLIVGLLKEAGFKALEMPGMADFEDVPPPTITLK